MGKVQITDFTDEKLDFIGVLIYKAAAKWFVENESAEQRENGFEQQKACKVLRCIRCGRSLHHWHYLYSEYEEGYVCADDRICRRPVITKSMKRLQKIKGRWAE